jgi:hypothetical protein
MAKCRQFAFNCCKFILEHSFDSNSLFWDVHLHKSKPLLAARGQDTKQGSRLRFQNRFY